MVGQNTSCKAHKVCISLWPMGWDDVRTRADESTRSPNCAPFYQLATLNDTYKYSFYSRAIRTWNSVPLSLIPNSLDEFKAIISSM